MCSGSSESMPPDLPSFKVLRASSISSILTSILIYMHTYIISIIRIRTGTRVSRMTHVRTFTLSHEAKVARAEVRVLWGRNYACSQLSLCAHSKTFRMYYSKNVVCLQQRILFHPFLLYYGTTLRLIVFLFCIFRVSLPDSKCNVKMGGSY